MGYSRSREILLNPVGVASATIPGSLTTFYTVPAGRVATIQIEFIVTGGSDPEIDAFLVPSGDAAGVANQLLQEVKFLKNAFGTRLPQVGSSYRLAAGGTIQMEQTNGANDCTVFFIINEV